MPENRVQFQKAMSLSQFMPQYDSEARCDRAATVGLDDRTANRQAHSLDFSFIPSVHRLCRHRLRGRQALRFLLNS